MPDDDGRPRPLVYAHRGASATHAENTLAAFAEALRLCADGIELDVRATRDGVAVVSHDGDLSRALGVDREIRELTAEELRAVAPSVPTLREVVALVGGRCHLDVEIKEAGVEAATLVALAPLPRDRWAISSFDWKVLTAVRRLDAAAELWVLCTVPDDAAFEAAEDLGGTTLAVLAATIDAGVVERATAEGRRVMAWTVNDARRAEVLAALGVAALCTDDPGTMVETFR